MNFFTKKLLELQKKKLEQSERKLVEIILKISELEDKNASDSIINNEKKLKKIWESNILKLKKEIQKIEHNK